MARRGLKQMLSLPILLLCLAGLIVLMTALNPEQPSTEPIANRSIYSSAPTGYRAWYIASKKAGAPMRVWEKPFLKLEQMPAPATMLMVEPYTVAKTSVIFGQKEATRLLDWVADGNTLVLLDDFRRFGSNSLAYTLSLEIERNRQAASTKAGNRSKQPGRIAQPVYITERTGAKKWLGNYVHLPLFSQTALRFGNTQSEYFPATVLAEDRQSHPVLIRIPYHKGSLILGTTVDIGDNVYLNGPANDNYQFLSNLLAMEKKPVFINEFIHGYVESGDVFSYYQKNTPLGAIFAQLVMAFLVMLWLSFTRWTPRPTEPEKSGLPGKPGGLSNYIDSMAGIYYRAQAASLALEPQLAHIEILLRRRFRTSLQEESRLRHLLGEALADYSNKGHLPEAEPDALFKALQRAQAVVEKQERLQPGDLLQLTQRLAVLENRLQTTKGREGRLTYDGTRSHTPQR